MNFDITEVPEWRQNKEGTSKLLSEIVEFYKKYELSQSAKQFCKDNFVRLMTVKFVLSVNVGELVGTQTADGTRAVLDDYIEKQSNQQSSSTKQESQVKDHLVTVNIYEALEQFFKLRDEMSGTGKLTVQQICGIHRVLMGGLQRDAGEMRKGNACTNDEDHTYPDPMTAEKMFYACIDHHSTHMTHYHEKLAQKAPSVESFGYLFKCAARLMFDFVDAHPFSNGNGRMCRLLANYVLSFITPFPVALYSSEEGRKDYMNAIVECRHHGVKGPGTLAAMLIEGTWRGWESLFNILEQHKLTLAIIGPVVVHKRDITEVRNKKVIEALRHRNIKNISHILEIVNNAIDEAHDVQAQAENDAVRKQITLPENVILYLHIYV